MKRKYALLMILVLLFSQSGCSSKKLYEAIEPYISGSDSAQPGQADSDSPQPDQAGSDSRSSDDHRNLFAPADFSLEGIQPRLIYYDETAQTDYNDKPGYLSFAYYDPEAEGDSPSVALSKGDTFYDSMFTIILDSGWVIAFIEDLPPDSDPDFDGEISLKIFDHDQEIRFPLSDLGEPMTGEELTSIGLSFIEGHACYVSHGSTRATEHDFSLFFRVIWVDEYQNLSLESVEKIAEKYHFYAGDGTPLDHYFDGYTMKIWPGTGRAGIDVSFLLDDESSQLEKNEAMCEELKACKPYMEYAGPDGITQRFPMLQN